MAFIEEQLNSIWFESEYSQEEISLYKDIYEYFREGKNYFTSNIEILQLFMEKVKSNDYQNNNELARIVEKDEGLTFNILKIVNSSFYGLSKKTKNLSFAILQMGTNFICSSIIKDSIEKCYDYLKNKFKKLDNSFNIFEEYENMIIFSRLIEYSAGLVYKEIFNIKKTTDIDFYVMNVALFSIFNRLLLLSFNSEIYNDVYIKHNKLFKIERVSYILLEEWNFPEIFLICIGSDLKVNKANDFFNFYEETLFSRAEKYLYIIEITSYFLFLIFEDTTLSKLFPAINSFKYQIDKTLLQNLNINEDKKNAIKEVLQSELKKNNYFGIGQ